MEHQCAASARGLQARFAHAIVFDLRVPPAILPAHAPRLGRADAVGAPGRARPRLGRAFLLRRRARARGLRALRHGADREDLPATPVRAGDPAHPLGAGDGRGRARRPATPGTHRSQDARLHGGGLDRGGADRCDVRQRVQARRGVVARAARAAQRPGLGRAAACARGRSHGRGLPGRARPQQSGPRHGRRRHAGGDGVRAPARRGALDDAHRAGAPPRGDARGSLRRDDAPARSGAAGGAGLRRVPPVHADRAAGARRAAAARRVRAGGGRRARGAPVRRVFALGGVARTA